MSEVKYHCFGPLNDAPYEGSPLFSDNNLKVKRIEPTIDEGYFIIFDQEKPPDIQHCCELITQQCNCWCDIHGTKCPDKVADYDRKKCEYYLLAENATYILEYCPWCGKKLSNQQI